MATDVATFRARLLEERAAVVAEIAAIDVPDEQAKMDAAQTAFDNSAALANYRKADRRWSLVQEKVARLPVIDAEIALLNP